MATRRGLRGRLLLELHFGRGAGNLLHRHDNQIAGLQQVGRGFVARPGEIGRRQHRVIGAQLDRGELRLDGGDEPRDVIALLNRVAPIVVLIFLGRSQVIAQNIGQIAAPAVAAVVGMQAVAHGLLGGLLRGEIQRGVDAQTLLVNRGGAVGVLEILPDVFDEVRGEIIPGRRNVQPERLLRGGFRLRSGDFAVMRHQAQHQVAARQRPFRMRGGRVNGPANDRRQRGGLRHRQLAHRHAEVIFRRGLESVISRAQINLVAVHREDLFLRVVPLDLQRQDRLFDFPVEAAVGAVQEKTAGKLHGQSAGALGDAVVSDIVPGGFEHAREIDAPVLLEMLVFGGENRVLEYLRNLAVGEQDAPLDGERADRLAVVGVEFGDDVRVVILERVDFRQVARIDEEKPAGGAQGDRADDQESKNQAAK